MCCLLLWPGGRQGDRQGQHSPRANSVLALAAAEHQFESGIVCVSLGILWAFTVKIVSFCHRCLCRTQTGMCSLLFPQPHDAHMTEAAL